MLNELRYKRVFEKAQADQLLISDPAAIYYLCGKWIFPGERFYALLCIRNRKPVMFVNELFRFEEELGFEKKYLKDTDSITEVLEGYLNPNKALGVDKTLPARFLLPILHQNLVCDLVDASLAVDLTRSIKDEEEKELMRKSSQINDQAMGEFKKLIVSGVTEKDVASQMLGIYQTLGASSYSFDPIVAFGDHAADPHHEPDDTVLREGDTVLLDVGCKFRGYCSDMTRTFFYKKEPSSEAKRVYNLVRKANEEAEAYVKAGVRLCDIDSVARDIITVGGYGEDFTHRLGHFIGLEDHEYGDVSQAFEQKTEVDNIFSIEPGIYHPGILGCRIEDLVIVTKDGCEVLNKYPKDIEIIN